MKPIKSITGIAAPLLRNNVDTDAIIPSREIKKISKLGLADGLFAEWRYSSVQNRIPDQNFILNKDPFQKSVILLTGENFGCGSSREHAVWALQEWGIKAIIGKSFGSIFYNNCIRNGLLAITLEEKIISGLIKNVEENPSDNHIFIDLIKCSIQCCDKEIFFDIHEKDRSLLIEGLDEIEKVLIYKNNIDSFEADHKKIRPWL